MTSPVSNENQDSNQEVKQNDKEYNFAQMRKQLEAERNARQQAEQKAAEYEKAMAEREKRTSSDREDEDDDEPYVDHKKLNKTLSKFERSMEEKIDQRAEQKARKLMDAERQNQWLRANPDFQEIMQHAQKFAEKDPELAETILEMPEGFERQKLVYKNIKALGLHKKEEPQSSVQDAIEKNKRSPYYQPSGIGSAPYQSAGDFSPAGQKSSYDKMKELQKRLRLG